MLMDKKTMLNLKNQKYISLLFYYCPDKCVSLVLLLAYGRGRVSGIVVSVW